MSDIKQKNDELESVNEHYARKDIETSTETQMLQRNLSGKQRFVLYLPMYVFYIENINSCPKRYR